MTRDCPDSRRRQRWEDLQLAEADVSDAREALAGMIGEPAPAAVPAWNERRVRLEGALRTMLSAERRQVDAIRRAGRRA